MVSCVEAGYVTLPSNVWGDKVFFRGSCDIVSTFDLTLNFLPYLYITQLFYLEPICYYNKCHHLNICQLLDR